jgi:hypothetical protein
VGHGLRGFQPVLKILFPKVSVLVPHLDMDLGIAQPVPLPDETRITGHQNPLMAQL